MSRLPSLGPRGEGWVAAQVLLAVVVAVAGLLGPGWPASVRGALLAVGVVLGVMGVVVLVLGVAHLGGSATPLPHPTDEAALRRDGVYGIVRHPIYLSVTTICLGWSLARSPYAFVATLVLTAFLELKTRREEAWLEHRYPEYEAYRRSVRWRFLPGIR